VAVSVPVTVCPPRRASRRRGGNAAQSLALSAVMVIPPRPSEVPVNVTGAMGRPWPGSWASAAAGDSTTATAPATSTSGSAAPWTRDDHLTWAATTIRNTASAGTATRATAPVSMLASPAALAASRTSATPAAPLA
jgi:hypothetical protein